jgi:hypothetical protein
MAKKINTITEAEFNAKGISSLADRPNQTSTYGTGGLTAQELKARFDALSSILKVKLNDLINVLASPQATEYIGLDGSLNGKDNLYALLSTIPTGEFSEVLKTEYLSDDGKTETIPLNTVIAMLQMSDSDFAERIASLERGGGGSTGGGGGVSITVDDALSETSKNPVQNKAIVSALSQKANVSDLDSKQDKLQAGKDIEIKGNEISVTLELDHNLNTNSLNPVQNRPIALAINELSVAKQNTISVYGGMLKFEATQNSEGGLENLGTEEFFDGAVATTYYAYKVVINTPKLLHHRIDTTKYQYSCGVYSDGGLKKVKKIKIAGSNLLSECVFYFSERLPIYGEGETTPFNKTDFNAPILYLEIIQNNYFNLGGSTFYCAPTAEIIISNP